MISFQGRVIRGDGYGKKIGFPTINITRSGWAKLAEKPRLGVYGGIIKLKKKEFKAAMVLGPEDSKGLPKLEAHILNFKRNIYGEKVIFEVHKFIRKFKNYKDEQELIAQIKKDVEEVQRS